MKKDYTIDYRSMSERNRREIMNQWAKTANRRLRRLRESGINVFDGSYEAGRYLKDMGRKTFPGERSKMSETQVLINLAILQNFLTSSTTTLSGISRITKDIIRRVNKRLEEAGEPLLSTDVDMNKVYDFLHTDLYKRLIEVYDSDEIVAEVTNFVKSERDTEQMRAAYEEFLNRDMGIDEIRELMNSPEFITKKPVRNTEKTIKKKVDRYERRFKKRR